ncbi:MAG: hypothetical protein ACOC7P_01170 [Chloroflexota bacterium]
MKNKPRWYPVLLIGLILLIAALVIGYGQYTKGRVEEAYLTGYNAGYGEGYNLGLAQCEQIEDEGEVIPPRDEGKELPSGAIQWYEARDHIGERTTVCGPVVSATWATGSKGKPTFLNIGEPYPDPDRFTVVIWIQNRGNFPQAPEDYYLGKTICVTGLITEYNGIVEIEVQYPSEIQDH